jgi:hypothetical protein
MPFHLSQMKPFFRPLGQKLSYQLSGQTTKPRRHAIVSEVATARAETAPTTAHALDGESLKATGVKFGHGEYASRCSLSGASGHRDDLPECPLLTQSGH